MAERKAQNKYYPPDWDPSKGSINQYVGQHPLRDRARKLDQGILIIRFEMPFNIWCGNCKEMIATGIRFNAEKKKIGNYYSTPILSFRMKCRFCGNWFEIHTDPKNGKYLVVKGAFKKNEDFSEDSDDPVTEKDVEAIKRRKTTDSIFKLEKTLEAEKRAAEQAKQIIELQGVSSSRYENYAKTNSFLRKQLRAKKAIAKEKALVMEKLQNKYSIQFNIDDETFSDKVYADSVGFGMNQTRGKNRSAEAVLPKPQSDMKSMSQPARELYKVALVNSDPFTCSKKGLTSKTSSRTTEFAGNKPTAFIKNPAIFVAPTASARNKVKNLSITEKSKQSNVSIIQQSNAPSSANTGLSSKTFLNPLDFVNYDSAASASDLEFP